MALIRKSNIKKGIEVVYQEVELSPYVGLVAYVYPWQKKKFVNFSLPFMTWQGHDRRVAEDLIDALKKVGRFQQKVTGRRAAWNAHAHEPTISTPNKVRVPVYGNHSEPFVQVERGADEFVKWTVKGHYFNDDLASVVAYVAAIQQLLNYAYDMR